MLLKLILPVSLKIFLFNVATRKFKITPVAYTRSLFDSADLSDHLFSLDGGFRGVSPGSERGECAFPGLGCCPKSIKRL